MLTHQDVLALKYRTKLVIDNLKHLHDGKDVHEVGNMLHTAQSILAVLDDEKDCEDLIKPMVERVEKQQVDFFKKKFGHYKPCLK
jgi:hypothetical protein